MEKINAVLFLCLLGLSACGVLDEGRWLGEYVYEADLGETVGGDNAVVTYKLTLVADTCRLEVKGYQTDELIICEQVSDGEKVAIDFVSYDGGAKTNSYGVEIYPSREKLFGLKRRGNTIETEWYALKPSEGASNTCMCFAKAAK